MKRHLQTALCALAVLVGLSRGGAGAEPGPEFWDLLRQGRQGDAEAQAALGKAYLEGDGITHDLVEAARWYRKAAEQGNPEGQFGLGLLHFEEPGQSDVPQDLARRLSRDNEALFGFFVPYYVQAGIRRDDSKAVRWLREAAAQGHARAQLVVGSVFMRGKGVAQDYYQAYLWYSLAAAGLRGADRERALRGRDEAAQHLTPFELDEARGEVREWRPMGIGAPR